MSMKLWHEVAVGRNGTIWVLAADEADARRRAEEELRDIGVLPGPMHEEWRRLVKATT